MPNWCENKLVVKGKSEELVKFIDEHVVDGELDYKTFDLRKRLFGENYFDTAPILNEGRGNHILVCNQMESSWRRRSLR